MLKGEEEKRMGRLKGVEEVKEMKEFVGEAEK